jgi:hypothetical protein
MRDPEDSFFQLFRELRGDPRYEKYSPDELLDATCEMFNEARARYQENAREPHLLVDLEEAAIYITGERFAENAMKLLEDFLKSHPNFWISCLERGAISKRRCEGLRDSYQSAKDEKIREKRSLAGKQKMKNLQQFRKKVLTPGSPRVRSGSRDQNS